jgi:hypothetical protein
VVRVLRIVKYVSYPFLALSFLMCLGLGMTSAFVTEFTVENRTAGVITVSPVGTVGPEGHKVPLPVKLAWMPLPAPQVGGFRLEPGEAVTIRYDSDDVNFSEIVVRDEEGHWRQLVTDPNPTARQYHGPAKRHFIIDALASLGEVPPSVRRAAEAAGSQWGLLVVLVVLLLGPWLVYGVSALLLRRAVRRSKQQVQA